MLSTQQKIELLDRTIENIEYAQQSPNNIDIGDIIHEVADGFVSPYYTHIVEQWVEMENPEPEDYWLEQNAQMPIHQLMTVAIIENATDYLYDTIDIADDIDNILTTLRADRTQLGQAIGYARLAKAIIE